MARSKPRDEKIEKYLNKLSRAFDTMFCYYRKQCDSAAKKLASYWELAARTCWDYLNDRISRYSARQKLEKLGKKFVKSFVPGFRRGYAAYTLMVDVADYLSRELSMPYEYFAGPVLEIVERECASIGESGRLFGDIRTASAIMDTIAHVARLYVVDSLERALESLESSREPEPKDAAILMLFRGNTKEPLSEEHVDKLREYTRLYEMVADLWVRYPPALDTYPFLDFRGFMQTYASRECSPQEAEKIADELDRNLPKGIKPPYAVEKLTRKAQREFQVGPGTGVSWEPFLLNRKGMRRRVRKIVYPYEYLLEEYLFIYGWEDWFREPVY